MSSRPAWGLLFGVMGLVNAMLWVDRDRAAARAAIVGVAALRGDDPDLAQGVR